MGKLASEELERLLSSIQTDPRVIIPPQPGYDSGVHLIGDKYLVVSTDPCIGVPESWFGWLLLHYAASDVALFGAKPQFCTTSLLGPTSTPSKVFFEIMKQACDAASDLGMAIVTGHTGTYAGLTALAGVCTAYGLVDREKLITPGGAKPHDHVLCVKPIGLEVAANFSLSHKTLAERLFGVKPALELRKTMRKQSCVREALLLADVSGVHAMHDATEGGLAVALNEIASASDVGFRVEFNRVMVSKEVQALREAFSLSDTQLLSMSSTGTILAAVDHKAKDEVESVLHSASIEACTIGRFTDDNRRVLVKNGREAPFPQRTDDPYERILSGKL